MYTLAECCIMWHNTCTSGSSVFAKVPEGLKKKEENRHLIQGPGILRCLYSLPMNTTAIFGKHHVSVDIFIILEWISPFVLENKFDVFEHTKKHRFTEEGLCWGNLFLISINKPLTISPHYSSYSLFLLTYMS